MGEWRQSDMRKLPFKTASEHWLQMEKPDTRMYRSISHGQFCHPKEQRPAFKAPYLPEEGGDPKRVFRSGSNWVYPFKLSEYRAQWTVADTERFKKPPYGWM